MITRRKFIKSTGIGLAALSLTSQGNILAAPWSFNNVDLTSLRPIPGKRKFSSKAIEDVIVKVKKDISDPELAWLFENCFPNTLDTTITYTETDGKPDTFVITGDIHAMWLRDSSAQVWPYLPYTKTDVALQRLIAGVINRQVKCILLDPYANAFLDGDEISEWKSDITEMKPGIHERKWEIDSLCYPIRLAYGYWKISGDASVFDSKWNDAMELIYATFRVQQRKENAGPYSFKRTTAWQTDTVPGNGMGNPMRPVGLICSIFRPSDDATIFPFLVPSNFFAVASLRQLSEICEKVTGNTALASKSRKLADEVELALKQFTISDYLNYGKVIAFETDGFGNRLMMDDSNVPSLLALPYLGCMDVNDPVYQNTRRFLLSDDNPWFFRGKAASGIGSPHTLRDKIWPMTIIMQAMTSSNTNEIKNCLHMLKNTHAGKGFMHESFNKDNPDDFTRSWFAWANTLFGELIIKVHTEHPEILKLSL
jgi:meiotically up-regulated gene 157 (Mug157) protein